VEDDVAEDEVGKAAFGADPADVAVVGGFDLLRRKNRLLLTFTRAILKAMLERKTQKIDC
jgi:hypothetical protein